MRTMYELYVFIFSVITFDHCVLWSNNQGYEINGNTFYMIAQDKKSTNQNSGVCFDATNNNREMHTYYGYIEEI